jgi:fatty-acyl-CoA synthase
LGRDNILSILTHDVDRPGIHCAAGVHGSPIDLSRSTLLSIARSTGHLFRRLGVKHGDRIATLLPTGHALLQSIFGAWACRAAICVMAPSIETGRSSLSLERLSKMLDIASPRVLVVAPDDEASIRPIADAINAKLLFPADLLASAGELDLDLGIEPNEIAFIQFSSGSTGLPKAIVIEHGQVIENIASMQRRQGFGPDDIMVSWMPIHHDFGLVYGLLLPIAAGAKLVLIPTDAFARKPTIWLESLNEWRGTYTAGTPSAINILSRPNYAKRLAGIDLSCLKSLFVGAEPISATGIRDFEETYAGQGLRPGVVHAGYGMAEATLVISARELNGPRRIAWVDKNKFHSSGIAELVPARAAGSMPLLANGQPLDCVNVQIFDAMNHKLADGVQGRIMISGACVTRRYLGVNDSPSENGWFDTGDLGFLLDGEVYVSGRSKDIIIRAGANIHAHEIEEIVLRALPELALRAVAFSVPRSSDLRDEIILGIELRTLPPPDGFQARVREVVTQGLELQLDHIIPMAKGAVPRTTSGKIQRGRARELYREGKLSLA